MKLSVVIPAHNEEGSVEQTVRAVADRLRREEIDYELVVVDDASTDGTAAIVRRLAAQDPAIRYVRSPYRGGFGFAVRAGLDVYTGDAVAIVMADSRTARMTWSPTTGCSRRASTARWARGSSAAERRTATRS